MEPNHVVKLAPLSAADVATVHGIAATRSITQAMDQAWQDTLKDWKEHGFFMYKDADGRYFAGRAVTGTEGELGPLYGTLVHANALRGDLRQVAAWFHTHPGTEENADQADSDDQNFGNTVEGITIILTHRGFLVGR